MAKKAFIGVDGKARKVKKGYIGVDNKARKVKKAYIGVGGVARPFLSSEPEYYGSIANLENVANQIVTAKTPNYTIMYGVSSKPTTLKEGSYSDKFTAYNKSLVKTAFPISTYMLSSKYQQALSLGQNAVFFSGAIASDGEDSFGSAYTSYGGKKTAICFNDSLVKVTFDWPNTTYHSYGASTSNDNYGILITGLTKGTDKLPKSYNCIAYDHNLTKTTLTISKYHVGGFGVNFGNYALVFGGRTDAKMPSKVSSGTKDVTAINSSLVVTYPIVLDKGAPNMGGASTNKYTLLGGGGDDGNSDNYYTYKTVYSYDKSLVKKNIADLTQHGAGVTAAANNGYVLFGGGTTYLYYGPLYNSVSIYDDTLVKTEKVLKISRAYAGATTIENYILFAGGIVYRDSDGGRENTNSVEVFTT